MVWLYILIGVLYILIGLLVVVVGVGLVFGVDEDEDFPRDKIGNIILRKSDIF